MSPYALTIATDDIVHRVSNRVARRFVSVRSSAGRTSVSVMVTPAGNDHRRVGARSQCSLSSAAGSRTHPGLAEILSTYDATPHGVVRMVRSAGRSQEPAAQSRLV